tara:strand:+ start:506 stop:1468 length:963 start_codon:yes stop_codon:yes gene_type:complete
MGVLSNVRRGAFLGAVVDREEENERFLKESLNKMKAHFIEFSVEDNKKMKQLEKQKGARISKGVELGLDKEVAMIMEATGELSPFIVRAVKLSDDPEKNYSKQAVNRINKVVLDNVSDEQLGKVMNYALEKGSGERMGMSEIIDIIYSATDKESLSKAVERTTKISSSSSPRLDPFKLNFQSLTELDPVKREQVRKDITNTIAPYLGAQWDTNSGVYRFGKDETNSAVIVNKAIEYYFDQRNDPLLQRDLTDVKEDIEKDIRALLDVNVTTEEIANNFEFGMDPSELVIKKDEKVPGGLNPPSVELDKTIIEKNNLATGG